MRLSIFNRNYLCAFGRWESSGSLFTETLGGTTQSGALNRERKDSCVSYSAVCEVHMKNGASLVYWNIQCWCSFWLSVCQRCEACLYSGWNSAGPQTTWMNLSHKWIHQHLFTNNSPQYASHVRGFICYWTNWSHLPWWQFPFLIGSYDLTENRKLFLIMWNLFIN